MVSYTVRLLKHIIFITLIYQVDVSYRGNLQVKKTQNSRLIESLFKSFVRLNSEPSLQLLLALKEVNFIQLDFSLLVKC